MLTNVPPSRPTTRALRIAIGLAICVVVTLGIRAFASPADDGLNSTFDAAGIFTLDPSGPNAPSSRLSLGATNLAAGDTAEFLVDIRDSGTVDLADVRLTTTARPESVLASDETNGLRLLVERCSVPWTGAAADDPSKYECRGSATIVLDDTPMIMANKTLSNLTLTAEADNFLRIKMTLPEAAGNAFADKATTITYAFTARQRASG